MQYVLEFIKESSGEYLPEIGTVINTAVGLNLGEMCLRFVRENPEAAAALNTALTEEAERIRYGGQEE